MDLTPDERASFDELAARARQLDDRDRALEAPPPEVWDAIEAALVAPTPIEPPTPLRPDERAGPRPRPYQWVVSIAAVALLVVLGGWLLSGRSDTTDTIVGRTDLQALDDTGAVVGDAELVDADGELRLQIQTEPLSPGDDGYLEVWVIDPDITELISLGPVRPDGTYDLPPGIDPERFPIVDISREPLNGDPTHSGDSLVQGQLEFA
jgi:anti-sigma-K factor RskA